MILCLHSFRLVLPIPQNYDRSIFPPETEAEATEARETLSIDGRFGGSEFESSSPPPPIPQEMDMANAVDGYGSAPRGGGGRSEYGEMDEAVRISAGVAGVIL